MNQNYKEIEFISKILDNAFERVIHTLELKDKSFCLSKTQKHIIFQEFNVLKKVFITALLNSETLANYSYQEKNNCKGRVHYFNEAMSKMRQFLLNRFPQSASVWVLDGLVFDNHTAGIKQLHGLNGKGKIIDVLGSASSINLGAHNPWLIMADRYEDHLQMRDNICTAYHPGIRQAFVLNQLALLHPNHTLHDSLVVHTESSGTVVNTIAIESALAFFEKYTSAKKQAKILAVDGTWAGGYGVTREATGFNVDAQQRNRIPENTWIDRSLPPPIKQNATKFLQLINQKICNNTVAGLLIEPDVIGDLGLITVDQETLLKTKKLLLKHNLPIILDCVQQMGRTGGYWGYNAEYLFSDYPLLLMTTAKSASNGQPFGFTIMPKIVANAAYPISHVTTNQMNGPLLRALVVAEIIQDKQLQRWIQQKTQMIEKISQSYNINLNDQGLRGKVLNRGVYIGDNELVKLTQIALLVEDGILVGAVPNAIRYQPMLLELSQTNQLVAHTIFRRVKKILKGDVSSLIKNIFERMKSVESGLARKNITEN